MSNATPDSSQPHRPRPLHLALFTFADARRQLTRRYHQAVLAVHADFAEAQHAIHADAWEELRSKHEHAVAAATTPEANDAVQAFVAAQQAYQSGAAFQESLQALAGEYQAKLAEIARTIGEQADASQRALVAEVKAATAALEAEALDAEAIAWLQLALQALRPGIASPEAGAAGAVAESPSPASPPSPPPPASGKPARAAKTGEGDHG